MLVEGPPGPEGPAVSGTLHLAPKDARSSGVRDARCAWRARHTALPALYCFHMPRMCTERFGVDFSGAKINRKL